MASGNFLIGRALSLQGFSQCVQPALEKRGYSVQDKFAVQHEHEETVLTSITGEGDLEKEINTILIEIGKAIDENAKTPNECRYRTYRTDHYETKNDKKVPVLKGNYTTLGVYSADDTASKLFPAIALEYAMKRTEITVDDVNQQIRELAKGLSNVP